MKISLKQTAVAIAISAALGGAVSGSAVAAVDWNFTSCSSGCTGGTYGNTINYNAVGGASSVAVNAWANTGGTNNTVIQSAYVVKYGGGFGIQNRDAVTGNDGDSNNDVDSGETGSPEHAVDNNERYDSVLFSFGGANKIALSQVSFGWIDTDADITVLAYTPSASNPALPMLGGLTYADLTSNGWTLVGHYAGASGNSSLAINAGTTPVSSSYWLVGAYNPTVGASNCVQPSGKNYSCTTGNDYFKISALRGDSVIPPPPPPPGDTKGVPEPGTLVLLAAAGLGLAVRRRKLS